MHATCTTLDIGSWWYLKSRPLCAIVKGYFFQWALARLLRGDRARLSLLRGLTLASALC